MFTSIVVIGGVVEHEGDRAAVGPAKRIEYEDGNRAGVGNHSDGLIVGAVAAISREHCAHALLESGAALFAGIARELRFVFAEGFDDLWIASAVSLPR